MKAIHLIPISLFSSWMLALLWAASWIAAVELSIYLYIIVGIERGWLVANNYRPGQVRYHYPWFHHAGHAALLMSLPIGWYWERFIVSVVTVYDDLHQHTWLAYGKGPFQYFLSRGGTNGPYWLSGLWLIEHPFTLFCRRFGASPLHLLPTLVNGYTLWQKFAGDVVGRFVSKRLGEILARF